jgi:hypothetical protein
MRKMISNEGTVYYLPDWEPKKGDKVLIKAEGPFYGLEGIIAESIAVSLVEEIVLVKIPDWGVEIFNKEDLSLQKEAE